jgi:hypothetical protein
MRPHQPRVNPIHPGDFLFAAHLLRRRTGEEVGDCSRVEREQPCCNHDDCQSV